MKHTIIYKAIAFCGLALVSISPALAGDNTYTGCRTPGGTLIHLAPGDQPLQSCAPAHTQVTLGGYGPGFVSDVETVNEVKSVALSGNGKEEVAVCPEGKKVIGGGALGNPVQVYLNGSYPNSDGTKWVAYFRNVEEGTILAELRVWAICAKVD